MLAAFAGYIVVHFGCYVLALRHREEFQQEGAIFQYHALPAVAVTLFWIAAVIVSPTSEVIAQAVLVVGLHGIYSLSFLELWSLSQIGYSLGILIECDTAERTDSEPDLAGLEQLGTAKRAGRVDGTQRLGLVKTVGPAVRLTKAGRGVAAALAGLARLVDLKRTL